MYQVGRQYELVIGDPATTEALVVKPPLQISFKVKKHIYNNNNLNTAEIHIHNLSLNTRKYFEGIKYPQVILSCGYIGTDNLAPIFRGQAVSVSSEKTNDGVVTVLNCGESFVQLHDLLTPFTVPKGKKVSDVIVALQEKMQGISIGKLSRGRIDNVLTSAFPVEGCARRVLNELSDTYKLQWRIDQNTLYVRDDGGTHKTSEKTVYDIDKYNGLIGIPSYEDKRAGKTDKDDSGLLGIEFKALLNPHITVGDFVHVTSEVGGIDDICQIRHIVYCGDFRGNDWYIEAECDELKKVGNG